MLVRKEKIFIFQNQNIIVFNAEMKRTEIIIHTFTFISTKYSMHRGHAVAQLVESLRYKPECRGFDSRLCHIFY
jgi:mannitol/fructose-specific phosphotransferase system IIA component (Ntr-type)